MSFRDELEELEYKQWRILSSDDGAEFYRRHLSGDALMTVPAPHGIMERDRIIGEVAAAPAIAEYSISDPRIIRLTEDSGIIVYPMMQRRNGQPGFDAAISSVYVRRNGEWQMAYHQQTPL